ncbi:MAG: PQQ-binding-like beta-propeller repeat protein [Candidatus Eremiobacteraeota bacterium]|nr:PQQ-binding-like beta-propeller repeat protein [Candidatus Eremiobacteraeota bacterium]MCW5868686.1 PQQ-binding-like beta-propeller repeat protein [Candidatus Eremiobacteraeota bacterium]
MDLLRRDLLRVAVKWGEGVNRQGEPYGWLIDSREFLLQGDYLERVCAELGPRLESYQIDSLAGYTLAAHPLALGLQAWAAARGRRLNVNLIRREPKADGLQRQIEGPPIQPGQRVLLVDDLINSGSTQVNAVRIVRQAGGVVAGVAVVLDYERSGAAWLRSQNIPVEKLFTLSQLGIQKPQGLPQLQPCWQITGVNRGEYTAPKSSACVRQDRLWIGSDQGDLLCLNRQGQELWRFGARDRQRGIHATPCEWQGRVYFGAYDGYLYCLCGQSGRLLWELRAGQWIGASALVDEGKLFVGVEYGEMGGSLIALEAMTGRQLWEAPAGDYVHSGACLAGPGVCFGANDGIVRAVERASGKLLWKFYTQGPIKSDLVSDGRRVLVAGGDGVLYCLDASSGQLLWQRRLSRQLYCRPLLLGELVLAGGDATCLIATRLQDGEVAWAAPLGSSLVGGACLGAGGHIWATGVAGTIGCFSQDGQPLAYWETGQPIRNRPAGDSDLTCIADMAGNLYAFDSSRQATS